MNVSYAKVIGDPNAYLVQGKSFVVSGIGKLCEQDFSITIIDKIMTLQKFIAESMKQIDELKNKIIQKYSEDGKSLSPTCSGFSDAIKEMDVMFNIETSFDGEIIKIKKTDDIKLTVFEKIALDTFIEWID